MNRHDLASVERMRHTGLRPVDRRVDGIDGPTWNRAALAVTAGVRVARWWQARRGGRFVALGAGVGVTLLALLSGALTRATIAVWAATLEPTTPPQLNADPGAS